jgi:pilus assembly protein Flp/PilA
MNGGTKMKLGKIIARIRRDNAGTSSVEMGLILAMIVLAMMGALQTFAGESVGMWNGIKTKTENAINGSSS